jgi:ketosteroid isomerase-like protein
MHRRRLLGGALAGMAALAAAPGRADETGQGRFDRAAYDRYVALMNTGDPRVVDFYADDIKFVMGIRGKAAVRDFYARHRPYVRESLDVLFFCADAAGAAAEVHSTLRCLKDCDDTSVFGRVLKAGEVMRTHGFLLYVLNPQGLIAEVKGPAPEVLQPWHLEAN